MIMDGEQGTVDFPSCERGVTGQERLPMAFMALHARVSSALRAGFSCVYACFPPRCRSVADVSGSL